MDTLTMYIGLALTAIFGNLLVFYFLKNTYNQILLIISFVVISFTKSDVKSYLLSEFTVKMLWFEINLSILSIYLLAGILFIFYIYKLINIPDNEVISTGEFVWNIFYIEKESSLTRKKLTKAKKTLIAANYFMLYHAVINFTFLSFLLFSLILSKILFF